MNPVHCYSDEKIIQFFLFEFLSLVQQNEQIFIFNSLHFQQPNSPNTSVYTNLKDKFTSRIKMYW